MIQSAQLFGHYQCVFVILNYLDKDHIAKQLAGVSKEELRGNISKWQRQFKAS